MAERPIIFNDAMVRAILAGRKTQTRRPFTPPKWVRPDEVEEFVAALSKYGGACAKRGRCDGVRNYVGPLGKAGDRLWVRECYAECDVSIPSIVYRADGGLPPSFGCEGCRGALRWRPSIHMPRYASRLTLAVESVRIERLHEITDDDAKAEGLLALTKDGEVKWGVAGVACPWREWSQRPRDAFARLWDGIYGTWEANPLVWVATFKVVTQ